VAEIPGCKARALDASTDTSTAASSEAESADARLLATRLRAGRQARRCDESQLKSLGPQLTPQSYPWARALKRTQLVPRGATGGISNIHSG
jgi:hypothetical protein